MNEQTYAGSGVMNSRPKQKPLRERTIAGRREGVGVSNSISSKSPGFSRIPAYKHHAAFAHFGAPALDHGGRKALGRHDADGHIDGQARPAACIFRVRHAAYHDLCHVFFKLLR